MDQDPSPDPLQPSKEFIDKAFDGVAPEPDVNRGCAVDVLPLSADFGFPMNLSDISSTTSNEFEANSEEVTRTIAALEFSSAPSQATAFDATSSEFQIGATFQASQKMFAPTTSIVESITLEAPIYPFYMTPTPTSFRSNKTLVELRSELENAFCKCSIAYTLIDNACGYSCSALKQLSVIEIDVKIYDAEGDLLVEVRRLTGCRHGFGELSLELASTLEVSFAGLDSSTDEEVTSTFLATAPPPLDDAMLDELGLTMPSLKVTFSHESDMLCEDSAPREALIQGARATAALAIEVVDYPSNAFEEGGEGMVLAERVGELVKSSDDEVRTVAMAAVANIATLEHVCGKWLDETIPLLVAGAQDDLPHVRREALRAIQAIAANDKVLAAKLVRAGVVPALELEAAGGEDSQSPDDAMQSFAEEALHACRA